MTGAGVHDHPRRLVQDSDVRILKQDVQMKGLGCQFRRFRRRNLNRDLIAFINSVSARRA